MTTQMMNENKHTYQIMNRLELQVSQMASQMGERERGTFPSQPVTNTRDTRANSFSHAQINAIHTLQSGMKVDNQVVMRDQINSSLLMADPSSSGSDKFEEKETEQIIEPPYEHQLHFLTD